MYRTNKSRFIEPIHYPKPGKDTRKFLAKLDAESPLKEATPAEREKIRRRLLGDVSQG